MECFSTHASRVVCKTRRPCLQQLAGETFSAPAQDMWPPQAAASSEITSLQPAGAGESERTLAPFMQSWGDSVSQVAGDFLPPAQLSVVSASVETASFAWEELPTDQSRVAQEVCASWRQSMQELAPQADDDKASSLCNSSMTMLAPSFALPERGLEDSSSIIETEVREGSFVAADLCALETEVLDGSGVAANMGGKQDDSHLKHGTDTPSTVTSHPAPPETGSPRSPISSCSNPLSAHCQPDTNEVCETQQNDPFHVTQITEACDIGQLQAEASALQMKALNLQTWINRLAHERCACRNLSCNCHEEEAVGGA